MKYKYQAKTKEGELQAGFVDAGSRDAAMNILSSHNLFTLELEETSKPHWYDRILSYTRRVKRHDLVIFTRQFSTLLEAHLPLSNVFTTLYEQTTNPTLKEAIYEISQDVDSGLALSQALERQSEVFPPFFISMVRSAEVTGTLDQVAGFLADYVERESSLVTKARSALIYPAIIVGLFMVVGVIMMTVVFPQIQTVFDQANIPLPLLSSIFIGIGVFLSRWWLLLLLALAAAVVITLDYIRTPEGQGVIDDLKVRLPLVRRVYLPLTVTRFANASAMLLKGGIPVAQALEIVGESVENIFYRDLLHEVSEEVRQGRTLSEALAGHPDYFPPLVPQMIVVGETTGTLDQMFMRIANFYGRESETIVNNLVDLIQPVLMIGVGLLVGLLFASILMPLYQLTSAIQ